MIRYFTFSILLILTFSVFVHAQKISKAEAKAIAIAKAKEKEVKDTFDLLVEGINQVDAEKVMSVYHNDPRTLFFNYNGSATIGWENMAANRKASYTDRKNVNLEITGLRVEILSPTSAYVSCKWKQTQEFKGELEQSTGRMTLIFKKFGKDWKVLHLHTSPDKFPSEVVIPASEKTEDQSAQRQK
jgi:ketosteroid isomerase-like protein